MEQSTHNEIDRARHFGQTIEELVLNKGRFPSGARNTMLIGYWSLLFDCHKGILSLLSAEFYGAAFALVRPVVEALVRSHLILICSEEDLRKIQEDEYRVNLKDVGSQIDKAFGLDVFEKFLKRTRTALHSYTHAGILQLGRRFDGDNLTPAYSDGAIVEVVHTTTTAMFMVTALVTKVFGFEDEWKTNSQLSGEWGKHHS